MTIPEPKPGLVFRYDFLWSREALKGQQQGKDRPACLVVASDNTAGPRFALILPITHSPPSSDTPAIELPPKVKQALRLDGAPSWVILSEYNVDEWPNAGLSPIPGRPEAYSYGFLPPGLFSQIKTMFLELARAKKARSVRR